MLTALTEKRLFSTAKPSEAHLRHVQRRKPSCEFAQPLCLRSIAPALGRSLAHDVEHEPARDHSILLFVPSLSAALKLNV